MVGLDAVLGHGLPADVSQGQYKTTACRSQYVNISAKGEKDCS